jgi:CDP-4-dehydro-6-deoxyglucose reductase
LDSGSSFVVTMQKSGKSFSVQADETILDAALKAGVILAYGCKNGACGSCKGKILSGETRIGPHNTTTLTPEEASRKTTLLCCSFAQSDCLIAAREIENDAIPIKKMPCRISDLSQVTPDVMVMKLQLPAIDRFEYRAGQYIEFLLKDQKKRAYSIATPPHLEGSIELHIRHLPGGLFTDQLFGVNSLTPFKIKDILRFEGPLGSFYLRENSDKPMIFLASGTGFAPIQAIIEHTIFKKIQRPIHLYWGGRRPVDLYAHQKCLQWSNDHQHLTYTPVVSDALETDGWNGRVGFVHHAVMQDYPDLSGFQVYACGNPMMVTSAQLDFQQTCNLPEDEFFADSFTSEVDLISKTS